MALLYFTLTIAHNLRECYVSGTDGTGLLQLETEK